MSHFYHFKLTITTPTRQQPSLCSLWREARQTASYCFICQFAVKNKSDKKKSKQKKPLKTLKHLFKHCNVNLCFRSCFLFTLYSLNTFDWKWEKVQCFLAELQCRIWWGGHTIAILTTQMINNISVMFIRNIQTLRPLVWPALKH